MGVIVTISVCVCHLGVHNVRVEDAGARARSGHHRYLVVVASAAATTSAPAAAARLYLQQLLWTITHVRRRCSVHGGAARAHVRGRVLTDMVDATATAILVHIVVSVLRPILLATTTTTSDDDRVHLLRLEATAV